MAKAKAYNAIVIGSGMGGLTASASLARNGFSTLLFEKEKQVGGYVASFKRGDCLFDATGAFVGGCQEGGEFWQLLKEIGVQEEIEFIPIRHIRNIYPGFEVHLHEGGFRSYLESLLELFPEEEKGLRAYLSLVKKIGEEVKTYSEMSQAKKILFPVYCWNLIRYQRTTHGGILDRFFRGEEIKQALHTLPSTEPPSRLSFLFVAAVISKALMEGVFYPKGGMGKLTEAIAKGFLDGGGQLHLQTEVEQILVKNGRVEGVVTRDGKVFESSIVISNINPNLLAKMFSPGRRPALGKRTRNLQYSLSCFILYLATDLDLGSMGFPYFTHLRFLSDLEGEYRMLYRGEVPKNPTLMISIPTLLDPRLAPPGQHLVKVLVTVPYHYRGTWGSGNAETYQQVKGEFSRGIIERLELKLIPHLREHLLFSEAATPLTLERYTGNERGAMYGLASTPQQMGPWRPSHRALIPGLYQVGHYTRPSHGIVGASLSGLFCARSILQERKS